MKWIFIRINYQCWTEKQSQEEKATKAVEDKIRSNTFSGRNYFLLADWQKDEGKYGNE